LSSKNNLKSLFLNDFLTLYAKLNLTPMGEGRTGRKAR